MKKLQIDFSAPITDISIRSKIDGSSHEIEISRMICEKNGNITIDIDNDPSVPNYTTRWGKLSTQVSKDDIIMALETL